VQAPPDIVRFFHQKEDSMKRTLIVVLMVLVCISTIFAAGQKETKPVIYGIYKAGDQTWFIDEGKAAQAAAESAGYSFTYVDAKMSPEEYLRAIDKCHRQQGSRYRHLYS
jgi:L-arabinose transport system substrate-binding protein